MMTPLLYLTGIFTVALKPPLGVYNAWLHQQLQANSVPVVSTAIIEREEDILLEVMGDGRFNLSITSREKPCTWPCDVNGNGQLDLIDYGLYQRGLGREIIRFDVELER